MNSKMTKLLQDIFINQMEKHIKDHFKIFKELKEFKIILMVIFLQVNFNKIKNHLENLFLKMVMFMKENLIKVIFMVMDY